ncbi:hypothetical protein pb186bvf_000432 [Paramecium bursaria]
MFNLRNIAKWNNFNFKLVNTAYLLKGESAEEKIASLDKIIYDHHVKRDKSWTTLDKRAAEIKKPGKERTIYASNQKRRADRQQMAFYCKYVLAQKDIKIPKE